MGTFLGLPTTRTGVEFRGPRPSNFGVGRRPEFDRNLYLCRETDDEQDRLSPFVGRNYCFWLQPRRRLRRRRPLLPPQQRPLPHLPQGRKKRVAVFDFDYATVQSYSSAVFGSNVDVGRGISDLTVKYLVQDGTYSVIDRKAMDKILTEQNFSNSDRANPNSAAKLGKILGVDAIIVGSVTQFGNETKNTNVGGGGGDWGGLLASAASATRRARRSLRSTRASSTSIPPRSWASPQGKGESRRESTSMTRRRRQLARMGRRRMPTSAAATFSRPSSARP